MTDTLVHPWMVHPRTGEPLRAVWVRPDGRPVWPIMGASEDDPEDDPDDDPEDDPDDEDEDADDPYADLDEAGLREKLREISKSKKRDVARIKRMRAKAKAEGKKAKPDDDPDRKFTRAELDEIRNEAEETTRTAAHAHVIRYAAENALTRAGFVFSEDDDRASAQLRRALKLMDTEDVEVDDDGHVIGLSDAIDELKGEFPNLFGKAGGTRQRKRPGNMSGTGKPTERKKSVTELQAEALFPGSRK